MRSREIISLVLASRSCSMGVRLSSFASDFVASCDGVEPLLAFFPRRCRNVSDIMFGLSCVSSNLEEYNKASFVVPLVFGKFLSSRKDTVQFIVQRKDIQSQHETLKAPNPQPTTLPLDLHHDQSNQSHRAFADIIQLIGPKTPLFRNLTTFVPLYTRHNLNRSDWCYHSHAIS